MSWLMTEKLKQIRADQVTHTDRGLCHTRRLIVEATALKLKTIDDKFAEVNATVEVNAKDNTRELN